MNKQLKDIVNDRTSGSADLLIKLSQLLSRNIKDRIKLLSLVNEADEQFTSFEVIKKYLKKVRSALNRGDEDALRTAVAVTSDRKEIYLSIFNNAIPFITTVNRVFTLSNSRTILEIIKLHKKTNPKLSISVTESRPNNEARLLSRKLLKEEIPVEFAADAYMPSFIERSDAVFIGADKLLKDGSVVNKTGSLNAAILADYFKKPCYVFAESAKVSSGFKNISSNPAEVWKHTSKKLKVHNNYFEIIPGNLITKIFTEEKWHR
jgi:translation initiation factor 2B subunit (eIF-2B alpha/beta/delta family)